MIGVCKHPAALALAGGALFFLGVLTGGALFPGGIAGRRPQPDGIVSGVPPQGGEPAPPGVPEEAGKVLARLGERARDLLARREALRAELRQTERARQLMIGERYHGDEEACLRLVGRQKRLEEEIAGTDQLLEETRRLEARLRRVMDNLAPSAPLGSEDAACLQSARAILGRTEPVSARGSAVIPEESWDPPGGTSEPGRSGKRREAP
jgi:hypothetical protein